MRSLLVVAVAGLVACEGDDAGGNPEQPPPPYYDPPLYCTVAVTEDTVAPVAREASITCPQKVTLQVAPAAGSGGWILLDAGHARQLLEVLPGASRPVDVTGLAGRSHQLCVGDDGVVHVFIHQYGEARDRVSFATYAGASTWFFEEIAKSKAVGTGACDAGAAAIAIDDDASRPTLYSRAADGKWTLAPLDAPGARVAGQGGVLTIDRNGDASFFHRILSPAGADIKVTREGEAPKLVGSLTVEAATAPDLVLRASTSSVEARSFAVVHRKAGIDVFLPDGAGGFTDVSVPLPAGAPLTGCDAANVAPCTETGTRVMHELGSFVVEAAGSRWVAFVDAKVDRTLRVVETDAGKAHELDFDRSTYELVLARIDGTTTEIRFRQPVPKPLSIDVRAMGDRIVAVAGGTEAGTRFIEIDAKKL